MSTLAERLRSVVGSGPPKGGLHGKPITDNGERRTDNGQQSTDIADALDGQWRECRGQRYLVVDRKYTPGHRHGRVAVADALPPWPRLQVLGASPDARLLFVDLETTGLTGGAGTLAFLIGCGWFDGGTFRTRQFFLSGYAGERALLEGVAEIAAGIDGVVTYNGKSFDLPLIETRFLFHRMDTPFAGLPHVDMLHPARRLWRAGEDDAGAQPSCRLTVLEQTLCGTARESDVQGFEIPARYFSYVRTGDPRPLGRVFEHNRLDLLALVMLTAEASRLLEEGPSAARTAREALGLGRLYERSGMMAEACSAYACAAGIGPLVESRPSLERGDVVTRAEALRGYAVLCRRDRRFVDAARAWQAILDLRRPPPHIAREATEALAVHHEHRLRDAHAARVFALQTLGFEATVSRRDAVRHRLARLERKLGAPATASLRF